MVNKSDNENGILMQIPPAPPRMRDEGEIGRHCCLRIKDLHHHS